MSLIYLIAGEQSGDILGARLMRAIKARRPDVAFTGIGGSEMAGQGLVSLFPIRELSLMGLLEVVPRILRLRSLLQQAIADIRSRAPDVLVTIDAPGFTLRVLRGLQPTGLRRAHYVAPQVWAWRENRVKQRRSQEIQGEEHFASSRGAGTPVTQIVPPPRQRDRRVLPADGYAPVDQTNEILEDAYAEPQGAVISAGQIVPPPPPYGRYPWAPSVYGYVPVYQSPWLRGPPPPR